MLADLRPFAMLILGVGGLYFFASLLWSITYPEKRVWPPKDATVGVKLRVWTATVAIFAAAFVFGVADWNALNWPAPVRWGIGLTLIIIGNVVVWSGVMKIGFAATSGEVDTLRTDGLYAWSRNPQYVADMAIIVGWAVLSASAATFLVAAFGVLILGIAPLTEEPWLEENYGQEYRDYKKSVRRYL